MVQNVNTIMFLFKLKIWNYIQHNLGFDLLIQKQFYILCCFFL